MASEYLKRCSVSLTIRNIQITPAIRHASEEVKGRQMIPISDHCAVHLEHLLLARGTTHGTAALGDGLAVSSKAKHPEAREWLTS